MTLFTQLSPTRPILAALLSCMLLQGHTQGGCGFISGSTDAAEAQQERASPELMRHSS